MTVDFNAIQRRAARAYEWVKSATPETMPGGAPFLPLSVREHFDNDWAVLFAEIAALKASAEALTKERDALVARLADVSGKLVIAKDEVHRLKRVQDAGEEQRAHLIGELDAARSALDDVTRERDAASKSLEVAEHRLDAMTDRWIAVNLAYGHVVDERDKLRNQPPTDDETVGVYERTAQVRAEHKAMAELTAENAWLRQQIGDAPRVKPEHWDALCTAVKLLAEGMRGLTVERDEARELLKDALEYTDSQFIDLYEAAEELAHDAIPMMTAESVLEHFPSDYEIKPLAFPAIRARDLLSLLDEAKKETDA